MHSVDYSKYSTPELLEVRSNIDVESSNYPALIAELEKRKPEIAAAKISAAEDAFFLAEQRVKIIGYFQIAASITILCLYIYQVFEHGYELLNSLIVLLIVILNFAAGVTAIKENNKYYWLSVVNQGLQVFSFSIGSVLGTYSGLGGVYMTIEWTEALEFGVLANFSPGYTLQDYQVNLSQQWIAIDALALLFIGALLTVRDARVNEENQK